MKVYSFDFDGVFHPYKNGWQGEDKIDEELTPGIKEVIDTLRKDGKVVIFSARARTDVGKEAIKKYLDSHDIAVDDITCIKPIAELYVDDRAITFDGDASTLLEKIKNFKPWMEKDNEDMTDEEARSSMGRSEYSKERQLKSDGTIAFIEDAIACPIGRKVATMLATSHEYPIPMAAEAVMFVNDYDWEIKSAPLSRIQGLSKPIKQNKVDKIAEDFKHRELLPLICVDKLHGIKPQSKGSLILMDGHHRKLGYIQGGHTETPIYFGKYKKITGEEKAEMLKSASGDVKHDELFKKFAREVEACAGIPARFLLGEKVLSADIVRIK